MEHSSKRSFVVPSSAYSYRAPSPPVIGVPVKNRDESQIVLEPLHGRVDPHLISKETLAIITGNRKQVSVDNTWRWKYEHRREAQRILDYLYLGPTSVIRDHDYLRREAITMIVVIRDARAPMALGSLARAATTLGISACYLDVDPVHILASFYKILSVINDHLLSNHYSSRMKVADGSRGLGRVLVVCDSGTERGPPLVVAYIMAVFGEDVMTALQFVNVQRFCCTFSEEAKRALLTWDGLLKAGAFVAMHSAHDDMTAFPDEAACYKTSIKRSIDDMMEDDDDVNMEWNASTDGERFEGRETFVPFQEVNY